jgi:hypothetical protein
MGAPRDFLEDNSQAASSKDEGLASRDFLAEPSKESLGTSVALALPRIGEDVIKGAYNAVQKVPGLYEAAKNEVPGLLDTLRQHPAHAARQAVAGLGELGQNVFNTPHNLVNYAANRLNLIPQDINQKVQMARMPDSSQEINATFGQPEYPGESLIRGTTRNALSLLGAGKVASVSNPLNLTAKNIAKDVLNTADQNKKIYSGLYTNLWNESAKNGINDMSHIVPSIDINTLRQFSPKKKIVGVEDFLKNPTLENAHRAKSDLLAMDRKLNDLTTMNRGEQKHSTAVKNAISDIQDNMFKNPQGQLNNSLLDKYNTIQKGYATEVVPYKNKAINKFKQNKISAKELVNSLSRGEFNAMRGQYHPAIGIRNMLRNHPYVYGLGTGAGIAGAAKMLYDNIMRNQSPHQ